MKRYLVLAGIPICCVLSGAEPDTHLLSIHLAPGKIPQRSISFGYVRPDEVKPMPEPILSDPDFAAWDTTNHVFTITPEAAKRLYWKVKELGPRDGAPMPFVLKAAGDPIYVGFFHSEASARMC